MKLNNIKQEIKDKLEIKDRRALLAVLSEIKKQLAGDNKMLLEQVQKILGNKAIKLEFPKEVNIANFPTYPQPPTKVKAEITNFPKPTEIKFPAYPKIPEYPKKVDIKKPTWWKEYDDKAVLSQITKAALAIDNALNNLFERAKLAENAIAVRLVEAEADRFYNAIAEAFAGGTLTGNVGITAPTSVKSGQKVVATAGTQEPLVAGVTDCKSVTVKAKVANTGLIYVGNSTVSSSDGFILSPGDTVSLDINDVNKVYIDSAVDGEGVSFIYVN